MLCFVTVVQSPGRPYAADAGGRPPCGRLILVRHAATDADSRGLLLGSRDEPLSGLGNVQAGKVAEFLLDMKVGKGAGSCFKFPSEVPCSRLRW